MGQRFIQWTVLSAYGTTVLLGPYECSILFWELGDNGVLKNLQFDHK